MGWWGNDDGGGGGGGGLDVFVRYLGRIMAIYLMKIILQKVHTLSVTFNVYSLFLCITWGGGFSVLRYHCVLGAGNRGNLCQFL